MNQRLIAACIAAPLVLILGGVALAVPLPYAAYSPGPTFDILGKDVNDAEIIQVDGHKAYYDDGQLRFTTVIPTPPGDKLSLADALSRWFDHDDAVLPYDYVHQPNESAAQEKHEGAVQMADSQDDAKVVALRELGYQVPERIKVAAVDKDGPAYGELLAKDSFLRVNGAKITSGDQIVKVVQASKDQPVRFLVRRQQRELSVSLTPVEMDGTLRVGVSLGLGYDFPFDIQLHVDPNVGGPSAGLMFSLAIYDTLTPGSLSGGGTVAGTGEIAPGGSPSCPGPASSCVVPIGGIAQKIAGAQDAGAKLFFVPQGNCPDVVHLHPDGMRLVKATSMHEARLALEKWADDHDADLPTC